MPTGVHHSWDPRRKLNPVRSSMGAHRDRRERQPPARWAPPRPPARSARPPPDLDPRSVERLGDEICGVELLVAQFGMTVDFAPQHHRLGGYGGGESLEAIGDVRGHGCSTSRGETMVSATMPADFIIFNPCRTVLHENARQEGSPGEAPVLLAQVGAGGIEIAERKTETDRFLWVGGERVAALGCLQVQPIAARVQNRRPPRGRRLRGREAARR